MPEQLFRKIINDFENNLLEILSFSESFIEKKMILLLFDYLNSGNFQGHKLFHTPEFLEDFIFPENISELKGLKKLGYKEIFGGGFSKLNGFRAKSCFSETIDGDKFWDSDTVYYDIEVFPQKKETIDNKNFRIDLVVILHRNLSHNKTEIRKVALECDGYEFHHTREQIDSDNIRSRKLQSAGYKVLRYSGREINSISNFKNYFDQAIKILYA